MTPKSYDNDSWMRRLYKAVTVLPPISGRKYPNKYEVIRLGENLCSLVSMALLGF